MISFSNYYNKLYSIFSHDNKLNSIPFEEILATIPTINKLQDIQQGSVVLVRTDLDMPIKDGKVVDFSRIKACSPTIKYCIEKGWKVVIFGHVGRDKEKSVVPVLKGYSDEIGHEIGLITDWMDENQLRLDDGFISKIDMAKSKSVFMLENTRKYDLETSLWTASKEDFPEICKKMYSLSKEFRDRLTDIEINEAISASNFDFSSSVLPLVMNKTALGFYISDEMKNHIICARKANMIVLSGLKINKLDDLENILERRIVKRVIAAGSLTMALIKAKAKLTGKNFCIGRAETDEKAKFFIPPNRIEQGKRIIRLCEEYNVELILPVDFVLDNGEVSEKIPPNRCQFDIGPKTRQLISKKVSEYIDESKKSKERFAFFYNGVFGKFENPLFENGTCVFISHLKHMTEAGILTYVGGGEGRLALLKYGQLSDITHAFTAGGTILKALSNRHIPYLQAMYLQAMDSNSSL